MAFAVPMHGVWRDLRPPRWVINGDDVVINGDGDEDEQLCPVVSDQGKRRAF